jgi:hypothetical protein
MYKDEFFPDSLDGSRDVFVQSGVPRLENGRVIFFTPNKQIDWVYLSDV